MRKEENSVMEFVNPYGSDSEYNPQRTQAERDEMPMTDMTEEFQRMADALVARLNEDFSVASPRSGDSGGNAVSTWFEKYKERFLQILTEIISDAAGQADSEEKQQEQFDNSLLVAKMVLPNVETELRAFALGRAALRWGGSAYPNFIEFSKPVQLHDGWWSIALEHIRTHRRVGQVVLDSEGNISTERTTTRQEVREALTVAT